LAHCGFRKAMSRWDKTLLCCSCAERQEKRRAIVLFFRVPAWSNCVC